MVFARAATNIEKVRGHGTKMLDDVHRRHREAGAIDETRDAAVKLDVIQRELAGFDFQRRFFIQVAHLHNIFVAIQRVVVQRNFCIERDDGFFAISQFNDGERI